MFEIRKQREQIGRLGFVAWDYDDIQRKPAHPKVLVVEHPLLWAAEGPFDQLLVDNPVLHSTYRSILAQMLHADLSPKKIQTAIETVLGEFASINAAYPNLLGKHNQAQLEVALSNFSHTLEERREELIRLLEL